MEKVVTQKDNIMKKEGGNECSSYEIKVRPKKNGYEARMTLKVIGVGKNPRISAYGQSKNESVYNILQKINERIIEYMNMHLIEKDTQLLIHDSISQSIKNLKITDHKVLNRVAQILVTLTNPKSFKSEQNTDNTIKTFNGFMRENQDYIYYEKDDDCLREDADLNSDNKLIKPIKSKSFEEVSTEWFKDKKKLTIKTKENVNPLSPKTLDGYYKILDQNLIPYFKNNKNISLITDQDYKKCIFSFNGSRNKECIYDVLKMVIAYAEKKSYLYHKPNIQKPEKDRKAEKKEILYIEIDRQELWLDKFEDAHTDTSLLFETILLSGMRPEEACGLKWEAIDFENDKIDVNNAYKQYAVYSETGQRIGYTRNDGELKSPESYRKIPLSRRLKEQLLIHLNEQKELFRKLGIKWKKNSYVFLNRYRQPFISENLPTPMKRFINKYKLEDMTPYGLRHSFATYCSEKGMDLEVLKVIMGHSDYRVTLMYYVAISEKRKKNAMEEIFKDVAS